MQNAASWMAEVRSRIESTLADYFEHKCKEATEISVDSLELVRGIEALTMRGGKRFRPIVLAAAYRAVNPAGDLGETLPIGAALEILQSYLLIHDDWMDQDDERRGGPAVHAAFRDQHPEHRANALAVLAGDLAAAYALELALDTQFPAGSREPALRQFVAIQKEVFFGQHLDLTANSNVQRMHDLKTTSYTVRGPLLLGAHLGAASSEQIAALTDFATPIGEAFQLADDLLGTFGDSSETGKPGNDLRNGKRTSLVAEVERLLPDDDRLDNVLRAESPTDAEVAAAVELIVSSGAKANVEQRLRDRLEQAQVALGAAPLDKDGVAVLDFVAQKLALRSA